MKTLLTKDLGGDGGKLVLDMADGNLELKLQFPVSKIVDPVMAALDPLKAKLEAIIPGSWENPLVDAAFDSVKAEITKLLTE